MENNNPWLEITKQRKEFDSEIVYKPESPLECARKCNEYPDSSYDDISDAEQLYYLYQTNDREDFLSNVYNEFGIESGDANSIWKYFQQYYNSNLEFDPSRFVNFMYDQGLWD